MFDNSKNNFKVFLNDVLSVRIGNKIFAYKVEKIAYNKGETADTIHMICKGKPDIIITK